MQRTLIQDLNKKIGEKIKICGWVDSRRDHGKIVFIDLRDRSGIVQVVTTEDVRQEWVLEIIGKIQKRPKNQENPKIRTGAIEIAAEKIKILNKAKTLPFELDKPVSEDLRMQYRYLDLRSERMKNNIILRHKIIKLIRDFLDKENFVEIETPILTKSTPEGARDYIVPSRLQPGKFYALPQSPQQYKQLLMVAGLEKYFQIARCFRDEDTRGDRQPEFTQLDLEMSFVEQEDILKLVQELMLKICPKASFQRLTHEQAIKKYKTDKPDLRKNKEDFAFCWILDWPLFEYNQEEKRWDPMHHIFTAPKDPNFKDPKSAKSWQHDLVLNGYEVGGGSIRIHDRKTQEKIFRLVGLSEKQIQEKFGHLLNAFEYGCPPHGGIASGLDRLIMLLAQEPSIREVIAFPKTGDGRDLMMNAPSKLDKKQLKELHIKCLTK
ncbi:MAG: aspartate--tRNA ligase [bacterium]